MCKILAAAGPAILVIVWSGTARSQEAAGITAEDVVQNAREAYGPPQEPACLPQKGDEIVVCAKQQDSSAFRIRSTSDLDPEGENATKDPVPRAPDVAGPGIFTGDPTFKVGAPPPPTLIIDITALPEPPEGSDADLIAKGEQPAR